jgi:hypothetical protein
MFAIKLNLFDLHWHQIAFRWVFYFLLMLQHMRMFIDVVSDVWGLKILCAKVFRMKTENFIRQTLDSFSIFILQPESMSERFWNLLTQKLSKILSHQIVSDPTVW